MAPQMLNIPINIPWKLVSASLDMMDLNPSKTAQGQEIAPSPWRTSLAIYAHEPRPEELDEALCNEIITFIKITCSITGYTPSSEDSGDIIDYSSKLDVEIGRIINDYFACYGVLLNVSVFPRPLWVEYILAPPVKKLPRIIDFEPKKRDLYQAATESGEILTGSRNAINTDKSFTSVEHSEFGVNVGASVPLGEGPGAPSAQAGVTPKWGQTDTDSHVFSTETSRERRESEGTTTNITQMYNLLTGYHAGTNRATFLMLPRPHQLQPTKRRTFVQGLREIEGIQDFFLVVSRPKDVEGLCIQALLETGHFVDISEEVDVQTAINGQWETDTVEIPYKISKGMSPIPASESIDKEFTVFQADSGWEFDPDEGDPGHVSVEEEIVVPSPNMTIGEGADSFSVKENNYNYQIVQPNKLFISGTLEWWWVGANFNRKYKVFIRRRTGVDEDQQQMEEDRERLLITQRSLTTCIKHDGKCLQVVDGGIDPPIFDPDVLGVQGVNIVNEITISNLNSGITTGPYNQIQTIMTNNANLPSRRIPGSTSLIDTDIFKDKIKKYLPKETLDKKLDEVPGLPSEVVTTVGKGTTISSILEMDLTKFAKLSGLSLEEAGKMRRLILGLPAKKSNKKSKEPKK